MKTIDPFIQATYKDYDPRVITFLSRVYDDCVANNEKLSNYFYCCLDLLAAQLKLYYIAFDSIGSDKKLSTQDSYKRVAKDPCIMILQKCHEQILNILGKLSLSPFDQARLKRVQVTDDTSAEEILNKLIEYTMKIPPNQKLEILISVMEKELGWEYTHALLNKSELEYAVRETNKVLEKR